MTPEDVRRRAAAKRNNERVKLIATALNATAIAMIGATVILPTVASFDFILTAKPWILLFCAVLLHLGAHGVLSFMRSED